MFQGMELASGQDATYVGREFTLLKKLDKFSQKQSAIVPNLPEMPGLALLYLGM